MKNRTLLSALIVVCGLAASATAVAGRVHGYLDGNELLAICTRPVSYLAGHRDMLPMIKILASEEHDLPFQEGVAGLPAVRDGAGQAAARRPGRRAHCDWSRYRNP